MPHRPGPQYAPQTRASAAERGYGSRWRRVRLSWLRRHPLCAACEADGRITAASVVDHVVPHKGDPLLLWDPGNWQSLCVRCHDAKTRREVRQAANGR